MQCSNNIICKLCSNSTYQLFQVQGYQFPTCFKCSEVITKGAVPQFHQETMNNRNILTSSSLNLASIIDLESALQNMDGEILIGVEGMCPLCKKVFNRRTVLLNHIRNHSADKKYTCNFCQKGFSQQANLRNHERIHRNDRPYVCECGKAFTQITNLNNHKRLHTGERPFVCIEINCGRSFAQVTNLNNHMKTHHKVQQYNCTQCSKKFHTVTRLNTHLASHCETNANEEFSCTICQSTFMDESLLKKHIQNHIFQNEARHLSLLPGNSTFDLNKKYRIKTEDDTQFTSLETFSIPISVSSMNPPSYQQQLQSMSGELFTNNVTKKVLSDRLNNFNTFLNSISSSNSILTQAAAINSSKFICNHCHSIFKSNQSLVRHVEKFHC
ncbi:unnamed protein product [Diamesa serratosioi]